MAAHYRVTDPADLGWDTFLVYLGGLPPESRTVAALSLATPDEPTLERGASEAWDWFDDHRGVRAVKWRTWDDALATGGRSRVPVTVGW